MPNKRSVLPIGGQVVEAHNAARKNAPIVSRKASLQQLSTGAAANVAVSPVTGGAGSGSELSTQTPSTLTVGGSGSAGVGSEASAFDHVHPMPGTFGAAGAGHAAGFVPDTGATTHSPYYLIGDDGVWHAQTSITNVGTVTAGTWQASTVGAAFGGTGQTSYTDGQLLIGDSSTGGLDKATLTAGSGISITNGHGSITVAATGGGGSLPTDYISGLQLSWVSGTSIKVSSGTAYVSGSNQAVTYGGGTITGLSTAANTFYYVYLYLSGSTPSIEVSTTAPASTYQGTARSKTGDSTRRYLGAILANSGGTAICDFVTNGGGDSFLYRYGESNNASPFRVLSGGTSTIFTTVSCSAVVPATSQSALLALVNSGIATSSTQNASVVITNSAINGNIMFLSSLPFGTVPNGVNSVYLYNSELMPLDASQAIEYKYGNAPSAGSLAIDVLGYQEVR